MDVGLRVQIVGSSGTNVLADGWLYVLQGSNITVGHASATGEVSALKSGGNATHPWEYTEKFELTVGASAGFYFSRGKSPIPNAVLSAQTSAFETLTVPPPAARAVAVSPSGTHTLAVTPVSNLNLTEHLLQIATPVEPDLLPVTFTLLPATYQTDGLPQGRAAFPPPPGGLTVREDSVATAPTAAARPRERAPQLTGSVDAAATGVRVRVLDASGNALQLLANGGSTAGVQEVSATLGAPSGTTRPFQVDLLLQNAGASFGPVQVLVIADGLAKPHFEVAFFLLTGVQIALVDDGDTNLDGSQPGPVRGEANETLVVDFLVSPQRGNASVITPVEAAALAAAKVGKTADQQAALDRAARRVADDRAKNLNRADLGAQSRVRRMVRLSIRSRARQLSAAQPVDVQHPEMPLWMGELELVGASQAAAEDLLQRRRHSQPPPAAGTTPPPLLQISFRWDITLRWDAPNSAATTRPFRYNQTIFADVAASLDLDSSDKLQSVTGRVATAAFSPAPTALAFPVSTRRAPELRFDDQRPWGRVAGAPLVPTTVIEFQPAILAGGVEVMRGGDADLKVSRLNINGAPLRTGRDPQGANFVAPASTDFTLPTIRVGGTTPPNADVLALIDALVQEFFDANNTQARVTLLPLARWQTTVRRIVTHESTIGAMQLQHFETRGAGRRTFKLPAFGHEQHMPLFGAPAGFGLGQIDSPPVTLNEMWSYLEGLRASIRLVMDIKAGIAFGLVQSQIATQPADLIQAVYQRAIVRAYNGNTEFRLNGTTFEIFPTGNDAARIPYPNTVLGTRVVYRGFRTAVPFTRADFGP